MTVAAFFAGMIIVGLFFAMFSGTPSEKEFE
jgi:hypothetical protein